jgi:catechol 2,3-dioxygenase-like lactoylglutathione lyase family enzyme
MERSPIEGSRWSIPDWVDRARFEPGEAFSEFRTGLDHVEFEVGSRAELEQWRDRLDALGIPHSGIKGMHKHIIVVRDPDNIQFEFFLPNAATEK